MDGWMDGPPLLGVYEGNTLVMNDDDDHGTMRIYDWVYYYKNQSDDFLDP